MVSQIHDKSSGGRAAPPFGGSPERKPAKGPALGPARLPGRRVAANARKENEIPLRHASEGISPTSEMPEIAEAMSLSARLA